MNFRKHSICFLFLASAAFMASGARPTNALARQLEAYTAPASRPAAPDDCQWLPDGESFARMSADGRKIIAYSASTGEQTEVLFDVANTREAQIPEIESFTLSPDASRILVATETEPIYRRSTTAVFYVYECRSRLLKPLSTDAKRQRAPLFSPDSRMVAFVDPATNNIRVAKLTYGTDILVTTDGAINEVINGVPDWSYEEEFATVNSMTWAPDNLSLCYLRYDESEVPAYFLTLYRGACDPKDSYSLYPGCFSYKYPVAGKPNARVSLHSYDIETRKTKEIALPASSVEYVPRIAFGPDPSLLMVTTLNRNQTRLEIFRVNPRSTVAKSVYVDDSKSWIPEDAYSDINYSQDGFTVGSLRSGFFRYYTYSYQGMPIAETGIDNADATAYYGKDAAGTRYFQAAAPTPMDRTVYAVDVKGRIRTLSDHTSGTTSAEFSPSFVYRTISHSDVNTPPVYTFFKNDKKLRVLEDNSAYRKSISALKSVVKEFFKIPASGNSPELNAYIVKPADFNPSRSYPVVMSQYSGPGSQSVLNKWALDWEQYFAANGYVVVCVDGRGTAGRGAEFMQCVYKRLGYFETIDQTSAARYIASQSWADSSRIGIYGWSYGGYEALMCATQGAETPFAAAVAVAPVTDWRFYDTIYTERFMLTPGQNEDGYDTSAPLARASALGCPLLMMYGTADDNVHPANTLEFAARLQNCGLLCDMLVFTNMNHSINGCSTRALVWARMFGFFNENLKVQ